MTLGNLSWVTCPGITGRDFWAGLLGRITGDLEGGEPMEPLGWITGRDHWAGSMVTPRVGNAWDHWAGSLGGSTGNFEGG